MRILPEDFVVDINMVVDTYLDDSNSESYFEKQKISKKVFIILFVNYDFTGYIHICISSRVDFNHILRLRVMNLKLFKLKCLPMKSMDNCIKMFVLNKYPFYGNHR